MRKLFAGSLVAAALTFSLTGALALAADPTVDQIYQAARSGHLGEAQQMMDQVQQMVQSNPDAAASLVKKWMNR